MLKAVIFDVDGTLIDSVDLHAKAWVEGFEAFGRKISFEAVRREIGKGSDQLLPVFLSEAAVRAQGEAINKRQSEIFKTVYLGRIRAFADVRPLFERLRSGGVKTALGSSAKGDELTAYKRCADIEDLVEEETTSDDVKTSKPAPDVFEAALKRLGSIAPGDALVVGDTPHDVEAARKAGVQAIGVLCGGRSAAELKAAGAIAVFRDPGDLLDRYSEWAEN